MSTWFEKGVDISDIFSLSEVRRYENKVIKKRLSADRIDAESIENEYKHHMLAYETTVVTTRPYPPERVGEYVFLAQDVAQGRPWKDGDSLQSLAKAIASVHRAGLLHNDLSRDNVFVDGNVVTIIDWGESRMQTSSSLMQESRLYEGANPILDTAEKLAECLWHYSTLYETHLS